HATGPRSALRLDHRHRRRARREHGRAVGSRGGRIGHRGPRFAKRHPRRAWRAVPGPRTHGPPLLRPHDPAPAVGHPAAAPNPLMLQTVSKTFFTTLAGSTTLKDLASRYGMRGPRSFARRFIAGETLDEAIAAARIIERSGMLQTLDLLGESVATATEADAATRTYLTVIDQIVRSGIGRNISLKLTQLGLTIDRATCVDNLRRILDAAAPHEFFVRIDMENSPFTQVTLDIFEAVWQQGYRNVGVVLQSCLPRSLADARRMNELGA